MGRHKCLSLADCFESPHAPLSYSSRSMRLFNSIVGILVSHMDSLRNDFPVGGPVHTCYGLLEMTNLVHNLRPMESEFCRPRHGGSFPNARHAKLLAAHRRLDAYQNRTFWPSISRFKFAEKTPKGVTGHLQSMHESCVPIAWSSMPLEPSLTAGISNPSSPDYPILSVFFPALHFNAAIKHSWDSEVESN